MPRSETRLEIDINEDVPYKLTSKQGDALSRYLDIVLTDNGLAVNLTGCTVKFYALKPDSKKIFNEAEITDSKRGRCQVELTDQALACEGMLKVELSIFSNDAKQILSTKVFGIYVTERIRDDDALVSSNEYGALVILMQDLHELQEEITEWHARLNAEFERITTENVSEWEEMRQGQRDEFNTFIDKSKNDMETWMSDITNDLANLQVFDFENLAALDFVRRKTVFVENTVVSTITSKFSNKKIADEVVVFEDDGHIKTTMTVYGKDGVSAFKKAVINTVFEDDRSVTEDCEGFNDYTVDLSLSTTISGGNF